jgi:hypothetical protein
MDKMAQSNAANAEESASANEELSGQDAELMDTVDVPVKIVGGGDLVFSPERASPRRRRNAARSQPSMSFVAGDSVLPTCT